MQTFSFVFVLLCLSEPYVHSVCCHTEVCSAEIKLQVSNAPFPFKKKRRIKRCFLFYPPKYYQKRKPEHLFEAVGSTADWAVSLSCMTPASCKHGWRTSEVPTSNQRCSRLKYESNIIHLNKNKNWNSLKTAFYNHVVIIETDITVNQSHYLLVNSLK